ncbi:bile acid:sodium symporter family protein [Paenirhodobacter populi]|uniref:bile acid:sodium symporter family protein n=1 Tax=Paenirhodobacter populi TaxID=2306993 RepID=UPI000FE374C7|nr:bile acid:sodium symporter family protein [Sinirhodobacter populi]RWR09006.1 bile acid:sodium symporter [Sinirhodobacter populi]
MGYLRRLGIDGYMMLLVAMVLLGALLPARGMAAEVLHFATYWAVALLFFVYGAKLDPASVRAGLLNWRLQGLTLGATFVLFPVLGLGLAAVFGGVLGPEMTTGLLFLSLLPSTVQSSIAFTSIAGGNIPAAICAASLSNMVGVVLTPALVSLVLHRDGGGVSADAVIKIGEQIVLPFVAGQLVRPWIGAFIRRHKLLTMIVDRGSILLIVYSAFSAGTVAGLWSHVPASRLLLLFGVIAVFLALAFAAMAAAGRGLRLPGPDRSALFFCGSTKSLASGLPIASALFPAASVGAIILPTMIYHISQLLLCSVIAQRIARHVQISSPGAAGRG